MVVECSLRKNGRVLPSLSHQVAAKSHAGAGFRLPLAVAAVVKFNSVIMSAVANAVPAALLA